MFKILLRTGKFLANQNGRTQYYNTKREAENKIFKLGKRGIGARPVVVRVKKQVVKKGGKKQLRRPQQRIIPDRKSDKKKGRHSFTPHHIIRME